MIFYLPQSLAFRKEYINRSSSLFVDTTLNKFLDNFVIGEDNKIIGFAGTTATMNFFFTDLIEEYLKSYETDVNANQNVGSSGPVDEPIDNQVK